MELFASVQVEKGKTQELFGKFINGCSVCGAQYTSGLKPEIVICQDCRAKIEYEVNLCCEMVADDISTYKWSDDYRHAFLLVALDKKDAYAEFGPINQFFMSTFMRSVADKIDEYIACYEGKQRLDDIDLAYVKHEIERTISEGGERWDTMFGDCILRSDGTHKADSQMMAAVNAWKSLKMKLIAKKAEQLFWDVDEKIDSIKF